MRRFFAPAQLAHAPIHEFYNGALAAFAEVPRRAEVILAAIGGAEPPADEGEAAIRAVHNGGYVDFLRSAHARWLSAGRAGDAIGYAWPVVRRRVVAEGMFVNVVVVVFIVIMRPPAGPFRWTRVPRKAGGP